MRPLTHSLNFTEVENGYAIARGVVPAFESVSSTRTLPQRVVCALNVTHKFHCENLLTLGILGICLGRRAFGSVPGS